MPEEPVPDHPEETYKPLTPGTVVYDHYTVQQVLSCRDHRTVYAATEETQRRWCPVCETMTLQDTGDEFCDECGAELTYGRYRLTEWMTDAWPQALETLIRDGVTHPGWLQPLETFVWETRRYLVQADREGKPLKAAQPPVTREDVLKWGLTLSEALQTLHGYGFAGVGLTPEDLMVTPARDMVITNFQTIAIYPHDPPFSPEARAEAQRRDIAGLASLLTILLIDGTENAETALDDQAVDPDIRDMLSRMAMGAYTDVRAVADDFRGLTSETETAGKESDAPPAMRRRYALAYRTGSRSDVGCVRPLNEDSLATADLSFVYESERDTIGVYVVTDGMGGHASGEIASRMAIQRILHTVTDRLIQAHIPEPADENGHPPYAALLADAVRDANQAILEAAAKNNSDMGATVTAALLVGATAYIANVGDSRTYLYRNDELTPITVDHSLVARLVAVGMIDRNEVYTHPQRNQVYRALGNAPDMEVDTFVHDLEPGDHLLLCSDGLWEMVRDHDMAAVLREAASPQEACDALVDRAKENGGEDNISVIVVQAVKIDDGIGMRHAAS